MAGPQVLNPGSKAKSSSAANVLAALTEEPRAVLLDIRASAAAKAAGTPDLRATKRRAVTLPFTRVTAAPPRCTLCCAE